MRPSFLLTFAALLSVSVAAQSLEFEVASIRPSAEQVQMASIGLHMSASQVRISYLSLKDYVAMAYNVLPGRVEGPDWLSQQRFDISAKLPDGRTADDVPAMMQKLLADRFELRMHRESKEQSVYQLTVGKDGPKVQASAVKDDTAAAGTVNVSGGGSASGVAIDLGGGASFTLANNQLVMKKTTMATLVNTLTRLLDRPVVDGTGLTGAYDMAIDLVPEDFNALIIRSAVNAGVVLPPQALRLLDGASPDPFSAPLQKFGLSLVSRRLPMDTIVVDSMRRNPTDN